jgi:hypothetical protein
MATVPVLASQNLAHPSAYEVTVTFRGGVTELASGVQSTDLVQSGAKKLFYLEWNALTSAQKTALETAFAAIKNSSASFTDSDNNSFTVTRDGDAQLSFRYIRVAGGGFRYSASLRLREV